MTQPIVPLETPQTRRFEKKKEKRDSTENAYWKS